MSTYSLSSSSPSVPPEIWLQIFHTATFIPGEWNVSATASHPGLFPSADELQNQAFKAVLPLRRAIVQVSRLWWQIGSEVLYASFHDSISNSYPQTYSIDHFERSLLSRPALGRLIKRLVLRWPRKGSPEIDHILQLCPNTRILSFYSADPARHVPWEPRILVDHIRIFDASVLYLSQKCIVHVLSCLPNVEMVHLSGLRLGDEESRYHGTLRLPLVHFLSLWFVGAQAIEYWTPLLSTADIPHLTSLSTNHNGRVSLPLSIDVWQRITFFTFPLGSYSAFEPGIFRSLTRLQLSNLQIRTLRHQISHFPFHQISHLTMIYRAIQCGRASQWKQTLEVFLGLKMPRLRVIQLHWGDDGIHSSLILSFGQDRDLEAFFDYLESSAHKFEQVGVQFQEVYTRNIYRVPTPIKDVVKSARDKMAIRLAPPFSAP